MKILVSACLLGENCKYNGKNNYSERVAKYLEGHEVIPVCPEVLGGLPTPRDPSEIVSGEVINCKGVNVAVSGRRRGGSADRQREWHRSGNLTVTKPQLRRKADL